MNVVSKFLPSKEFIFLFISKKFPRDKLLQYFLSSIIAVAYGEIILVRAVIRELEERSNNSFSIALFYDSLSLTQARVVT